MADAKIRYIGEDKASDVAKKVGKSFNKLDKNLKKTEKGAASLRLRISRLRNTLLLGSFAVGGFGFALAKVISNTSDLEEELQKFGVVFGNVSAQATKASEDLAKGFGLSQVSAVRLLGTTGDLLTGLGFVSDEALDLSVEINTLAGDLASFSNLQGGTSRASSILTKALLGEREALASLGIKILETDIKQRALQKGVKITNGEIDRQEKALITLELATEQSKNAIGDAERSQFSFANQSRRLGEGLTDLSTAVGQKVLPSFGKLLVITNKALGVFTTFLNRNNLLIKSEKELLEIRDRNIKIIQRTNTKALVDPLIEQNLAIQKLIATRKKQVEDDAKALAAEKQAAIDKKAANEKTIADALAERDAIKAKTEAREKEIEILVEEIEVTEAGIIKRKESEIQAAEAAAKEVERQAKAQKDRVKALNAAPEKAFASAVSGVFNLLENSIASAFESLITGSETGIEAFENFGRALLSIAAKLIARLIILKALLAIAGGPTGTIFGVGVSAIAGGFQTGVGARRIVPGPSNQAVPIIAHGGEELSRGGGGGVVIQVMGNIFNSEETITEIVSGLNDLRARTGVQIVS